MGNATRYPLGGTFMSNWWIGIVTKSRFDEELIFKISKILRGKLDKTEPFTYKRNNETIQVNAKEKMSELETIEFIKERMKDKISSICFDFGKKNPDGFDGLMFIKKIKQGVEIDFNFEDYIIQNRMAVEKILDLCEIVYKSLDAFYAYFTWEHEDVGIKGLENYDEFKKVFAEYKKTGKSPFDIKNFKRQIEKRYKLFWTDIETLKRK